MDQQKRMRRRWWTWVGPLLPTVVLGCTTTSKCHIDNCATIPQGAIPAPAGTYVREAADRQSFKAEADDFVIYKHEWYKGGRGLGPYGTYHLGEIAKRIPTVPFPVLIEVVAGDPELNEARRQLIVRQLVSAGIGNAEERVVLGFSAAGGLYGDEAQTIFSNLIQGQQNGGFGNSNFGFGAQGAGRGNFGNGGLGAFGGGGGGFGGGGGGFGIR